MWVSRKRLKSADSYIRIIVLCFSVFVILIIAVLQPSEVTHNQIQDDETQTDKFDISNHDPKHTSLRLSETDPPVVTNGQIDVSVNEGIAQRLRWDIDDAFSDKYVIYRNGTEVANGTYGNPFTVYDTSINLVRGLYNFTIFANDTSANFVTDTAYVTVLDVTGPIVADTGDFNTTEVSSGNEIPWIGTDIHPSHFIIYRNNTEVKTGLWNSSIETIMYNIDDLSVGVYNFSIEMYDDSNNKGTDDVIIHVTDVSSPVILSSTDPLRFSEFDVGRNLVLNVTDSHPNNYTIFQDGIEVTNGSWINNQLIIYNLDYLAIENYTFSILLYDEFNNSLQIDIDVEIYKVIFVDSKEPQFTITTQVHEGDYETIQSNWLDFLDNPINNVNITLSLFEGQTLINQFNYLNHTNSVGSFNLILNYTGLPASDYRWEIAFDNIEYISQILTFNFTVLPHSYQIIVTELTDLTQGEEFEIEVTIIYANSQSSLNINSLVQNTGTVSGVDVQFEILVTLLDGKQSSIHGSGSTNTNGKVIFTLSIFETSIIASVDSITIQTVDDQFSSPVSVNLPINQLPVIISTQSSSNQNQVNQFQIVEDYMIFVLSVIFLILILILLLRRIWSSQKKKSDDLREVYNLSFAELSAVSTIQLVLLTSNTGLPLYERKFKTMGLDTVLLSGVTSAISSLLSEAQDQQIFGLEIMENRGLSIVSHKGKNSSLIFISSDSLPFTILSQITEAHESIEEKYGASLVRSISDGVPPEEINQIFRDHDLKLDLLSNIEIDSVALKKFHSGENIKNGLKSLTSILLEIDFNQIEIQDVGRLIKIYEECGFDSGYVSNFILRIYKEGIITSKIQ